MLKPGHIIDRYKVESVIGTGGTAVVYRVRHESLGTAHALKVLSVTSDVIRDRMLQEGRVQASLRHPNVVAVTDVLDVEGAPGLLMEYIEGPSLQRALKEYKLPLEAAELLFLGIVAGVAEAHREGLVHRDLKPANVLLAKTSEGFVPKVTDFGLAKVLVENEEPGHGHTRSGVAMGTPAYMAIEQIRDAKTVDQRADVFSLGCMLYELVCGQRAFPGDDAISIYNAIMQGLYVPPQQLVPTLPDRIDNAIRGALEQDKEVRIPSCEVLLEVMRGEQVWIVAEEPDLTEEDPPTIETARPADPQAPEMVIALAPPQADPEERTDLPQSALEAALGSIDHLEAPVEEEDPLYATIGAAGDHIAPYNFSESDEDAWLSESDSPFLPPPQEPELSQEEFVATGSSSRRGAVVLLLVVLLTLAVGAILFSFGGDGSSPKSSDEQIVQAEQPDAQARTASDGVASASNEGASATSSKAAATPPVATTRPAPSKSATAERSTTPSEPAVAAAPPVTQSKPRAPLSRREPTVPVSKKKPAARRPVIDPEPVGSSPRMDLPPPPAPSTPVTVKLLSKPPTALLSIDGRDVGRTPSKLELLPGTHRVTVQSGSKIGEFTVKVVDRAENKWCWEFDKATAHTGSCPR